VIPRFYPTLERSLREGAALGFRRAHKHVEYPTEEAIVDSIVDSLLLVLGENFVMPSEEAN
jgi:hypothetical protein